MGRGRRGWIAAWAGLLALAVGTAAHAQTMLTAEEAVRIALERNPTLRSDEAGIRAASGSRLAARSAILPQLDAGTRFTVNDQARSFFVNNRIVDDARSTSGSATLSQSLVNLGAWDNIRSASRLETAAREGYAASRADIALATYRQYYTLLKQQKLHTVAEQALQLTRDQLRRTQALFELGSVARGDVLKQQLQVSQAELDEITSRRSVAVERARLAGLLGLPAGEPLQIDTTLTAGTLNVDSVAVLQEALRSRPELAELRARLGSAEANVGASKALRYPTLDAAGGYSFQTPGIPEQWRLIDETASWNVAFNVGIPIFDGLNAKGRIREAQARRTQAEYALRQRELDLFVEVEEALQLASQSNERIRVTTDALAVAEEDLKLSQERYNVGSATVIELIDAQVALTRARSDYVSALADFQYSLANLRRVRGERF